MPAAPAGRATTRWSCHADARCLGLDPLPRCCLVFCVCFIFQAYELATLTGTQVLLLVVSETGIVYTFTTTKFQPLVGAGEGGLPSDGQRLIQQCLVSSAQLHGLTYP